MTDCRIDAERLWVDIMALAGITEPDRPWTRRSFTPLYDKGRSWLRSRMEEAGLAVRVDSAGNMIGRREGRMQGEPAIVIGSHTDTVPSGGRFDGIAGVCVGLEIARALREACVNLDHPLEVIDFLAEEPSDFGLSCIGSRGLVGELTPAMLDYSHPDGRVLRSVIEAVGGSPDELTVPLREDIAAYFELHIEQARVLESAGLSVGVVTSIAAVTRIAVAFEGFADHAGATPLDLRSDALLSAAATVVATRAEAERIAAGSDDYLVATVGMLEITPNAANIVPSEALLTIDLRSGRYEDADTFIAAIDRATLDAATRYGAERSRFEIVSRSTPAAADPDLRALLRDVSGELGIRTTELSSGAGHDALFVSKLAPMAMVFTPCRDGKSHCPEEWAEKNDLRDGANAILLAVRRVDAQRRGRAAMQA